MERVARRIEPELPQEQLARALELLAPAVIVVGLSGEVFWSNGEARRLLHDRDGLGLRELSDLVARTFASKSDLGLTILGRPSGRKPYQAAVVQTGPGTAIVFVHDPESPRRGCTSALRKLYGFTKAEAAVAASLMEGKNLSEVASVLHVSTNTVRAHLKRLFAKTRTSRQAELVLLLGGGVIPLASSFELEIEN